MALWGGTLLLALLVIGAGIFLLTAWIERQSWQDRQGEVAHHTGEAVAAFVQRVHDSLSVVGALGQDTLEAEPGVMASLLRQNDVLSEVIGVDAKGDWFASASRDEPVLTSLGSIADSRWFQQAHAGSTYVGDLQISPRGQPGLIMAVPASEGGAVAARVRMDVLWEVVTDIEFGEIGQIYIVSPTGEIVAHTDPKVVLALTNIQGRPEMVALSQSPGYTWHGTYDNLEGEQVVGVTAPVPGTEWVVVTELSRSQSTFVSRTVLFSVGGGILLAGVLMLWIGRGFLERVVFRPMDRLQAGAERIGQGALEHRIDIAQQSEMGQVAAALNEMANRLQWQYEELASKTVALTAEVAERKRAEDALQTAHDDLEARVKGPMTELSLMLDAAKDISSTLDLEEVLALIAEKMVKAIEVDGCTIFRFDREVDAIVTWLEWQRSGGAILGKPVSVCDLDDFPARRVVLETHHPLTVQFSDPDADPAEIACMGETGSASMLLLPLIAGDRVVGLVELNTYEHEHAFTVAEIRLCQALADQAAIAIENAQLYDQAQREIAERERVEEQVRASLQEKEALLKEIHHRVKNNLQVISSLLYLQSYSTQESDVLEMFQESQNRIRSMALIHEKLYQSPDLTSIDFAAYARELVAYLLRSYGAASGFITSEIDANGVSMGLDAAIPCGLIITELVSNSLKHAFPDCQGGRVRVALCHDADEYRLVVGDNGVGLAAGLDFRNTESLGLQLVNSLVEQLDGKVECQNTGGTQFEIVFPESR
jgi:two-component sensor histidine kinase/HAMP domain-containing protein